jgi:hypothetical protein
MVSLADIKEMNGKTAMIVAVLSMCVSAGIYVQTVRTVSAQVQVHTENFAKMPPPEKVANTDVVNAQYEDLKQEIRDTKKDIEDLNSYLREHK